MRKTGLLSIWLVPLLSAAQAHTETVVITPRDWVAILNDGDPCCCPRTCSFNR